MFEIILMYKSKAIPISGCRIDQAKAIQMGMKM